MSRSLKVAPQYIKQVKSALRRHRFARQQDLAQDLQLSLSTVSNFLNGRPVDYLNFWEICSRLAQDWEKIADFDDNSTEDTSLGREAECEEATLALAEIEVEPEVPNYVERPPIESRCFKTIKQPGSLLRIKGSKRMGKTWLIDRILAKALKHNYRTVSLSLLLADGAVLQGLDEFLRWFCVVVCRQLGLPTQLADYWEEGFGSSYNCTLYFEQHLLTQINSPLVLVIDEVDRVFGVPFAGDFLGMLRAWHEKAKSRPLWQKLRLIVAHSTEVYIPLNLNHSPFNVGIAIDLPEFSQEQVQDLGKRQGLDWDSSQVNQLMSLVGGHPYRVQRAIYCLTNQEITFEGFLQTAHTESGIYSSHLRGHLCNLRQYPELATAMKKVVEVTQPVQLEATQGFKLQSLGLVILEGNDVKPRCDLYSKYFRQHL
ncbi:AAA-like domain-containing protein [Moorena producens]|uniref:AAA-like domain-containing protein n=1 Tax=Moorena producens TaxID=1155739 RepID=UPI003C7150BD